MKQFSLAALRGNVPPRLFKYFSAPPTGDNQAVDSKSRGFWGFNGLLNKTVHFSRREDLNDPFDPMYRVTKSPLTTAMLVESGKRLKMDAVQIEHFRTAGGNRKQLYRAVREGVIQFIHELIQKAGICCFSETVTNHLMWSHYASNYSGFCLEFNTAALGQVHATIFKKILPVQYQKCVPQLALRPIVEKGDYEDVAKKCLLSKAKPWRYEQEWRAFVSSSGQDIRYGEDALYAIHIGYRISIEEIRLLFTAIEMCPCRVMCVYPADGTYDLESAEVLAEPAGNGTFRARWSSNTEWQAVGPSRVDAIFRLIEDRRSQLHSMADDGGA